MPASFTALQRDRLKLFLRVTAVSAGVGAVYGALLRTGTPIAVSILTGVLNGIVIAAAVGAIEIFLLREGTSMKRLVRLPFVAVVLLKSLVYGAIVCAAIAGTPYLAQVLPGVAPPAPLESRAALVTLGFSLGTTVIFVIVLQAAGLVGRRTFRDLVMGRYRQPRAERRFFLMEESLSKLKEQFQKRFFTEAGLRAALHLGEVIAGEVGEQRRAIVFHGDVMNTAARLEQATRDIGVRFIASADALSALGPQPDMELKDLGALTLRGRREPIRAWGVESR